MKRIVFGLINLFFMSVLFSYNTVLAQSFDDPELQITAAISDAGKSCIASNGDNYFVIWTENVLKYNSYAQYDLYGQFFDLNGNPMRYYRKLWMSV